MKYICRRGQKDYARSYGNYKSKKCIDCSNRYKPTSAAQKRCNTCRIYNKSTYEKAIKTIRIYWYKKDCSISQEGLKGVIENIFK